MEYLALLDRSFYMIGETDCDMHIPLCVIYRAVDSVNKRKRTEEGKEKKLARSENYFKAKREREQQSRIGGDSSSSGYSSGRWKGRRGW